MKSRFLIAAAAAGCIVLSSTGASALGGAPKVPVVVNTSGGELDGCGLGQVDVKTFASVRSAPSVNAAELDRLVNGRQFCWADEKPNGWIGVVYSTDGRNCFPGRRPKRPTPYRGTCRSGWVSARLTHLVAG